MCGIFGWHLSKAARISIAQREALAASLAASNTSRGGMSWGTYSLLRSKAGVLETPEILREVGPMDAVRGISTLGLADVVMAHTRYATKGAITKENCHPYVVGDVTLAHNGMIYNHEEMDRKHKRTCAVDSMHLAHHLAERLPFTDLEGYGAIQYVRAAEPGEVHLSRMAGGQLAICGLGGRGAPWGTAWSSDAAHLHAALSGAGVTYFPYEVLKQGRVYVASADGVFYLLPTDTLRHDLAESQRDVRAVAYSQWLTTGAQGNKPSPGRSLSRAEKRRERKARINAADTAGKPGATVADVRAKLDAFHLSRLASESQRIVKAPTSLVDPSEDDGGETRYTTADQDELNEILSHWRDRSGPDNLSH